MVHRCDELAELLTSRRKTMCCAESCTGGMIGAVITDMPGASSFFNGSAVTYSNQSKIDVLGVPEDVIASHGAVSAETAEAMALGAARVYSADYSVAVTGIAGPGGATADKPVGLVYIAVSDGSRCIVSRNVFDGDRGAVRSRTVEQAVDLLFDFVCGRL